MGPLLPSCFRKQQRMYKILIIEDHETLGYVLVEYLKMHGFDPILENSAEAGLIRLKNELPHLCLLDVSLPGMDGFEMAKNIKQSQKDMPIIFLTARGLKVDKIKGLMLQADDYLVKPIDEEELVLRIRSVLRRTYSHINATDDNYTIGNLAFEPSNQVLKWEGGSQMLTEKESAILHILCKQKGNLVSRKSILKEVWGKSDQFSARTMDVHLAKLRKYISVSPSVSIVNVHGQGFILKEN
jgi:two-component system OmpR family response regulator